MGRTSVLVVVGWLAFSALACTPGDGPAGASPGNEASVAELGSDGGAGASGPFADPGKPSQLFGPKCWGYAGFEDNGLRGQEFPIDGTAYAHSGPRGTQLYLAVASSSPQVRQVYVSLVLPLKTWAPGIYSNVLVGRIEVDLTDGRRYVNEGTAVSAGGVLMPLTLQVNQATPSGVAEPSHYLRGTLDAVLGRYGAAEPPLFLHVQIDADAPTEQPTSGLSMDCRPNLPGAVVFRPTCGLGRSNDNPRVVCRQPDGIGYFDLLVRRPADLDIGVPLRLGGLDPVIAVGGEIIGTNTKAPIGSGSEKGYVIVHDYQPDKTLVAQVIAATVGWMPDLEHNAASNCRLSERPFFATIGGE